MDSALGLLLACTASALFAVGVSIQALDARRAPPEHGLRVSLLRRLVRRPRWLFGTWLAVSGWPFHLVALLLAPLTVVQPALASGLLLLLVLGDRMLGERVGAREVTGVVAIIVGVGGMALAAPGHVSSHAGAERIGPALGLIALVALSPYLLRGRSAATSIAVPVAAGCAFAFTGLASKLVADFISDGSTLPIIGWLFAIGTMAGVGLLSEMSALQSRPATQVAPIVFVVQITLPVLLAPVLGGESWSGTPLGGAVLAIFLVSVASGAWILGSTRAVSGLVGARTEGVEPMPSGDPGV
jgi:drug/metabolite transporter (DMT)-like permease